MTLKLKLAEAQDTVDQLKDENATQSAVIEMLRIRCGALESHVQDLERAYQLAVHQREEQLQDVKQLVKSGIL